MPHFQASSQLLSLAYLALLASSTTATSTPCTTALCPTKDNKGNPTCKYSNMTAAAIGVTAFNTSLSPQLLTWTVAVSKPNQNATSFQRDYLLGTPSNFTQQLQTQSNSSKRACTLLFEGASSNLAFPGNNPRFDEGTCYTALGTKCGLGLQFLAYAELGQILHSNDTDKSPETVCTKLGDRLRKQPPASCKMAAGGDWGNIIAKPLLTAESNATHTPLKKEECRPTTGGANYSVEVVASTQVATGTNQTELTKALYGVTPILTVVYEEGEKLKKDPEIDFSCVKVIDMGGKGGGLGLGGKFESGVSKLGGNTLVAMGVAVLTVAVGSLMI